MYRLLLAICWVLLAMPFSGFGQNVLKATFISTERQILPLSAAFREVQNESKMFFVYQPGLVDIYKDVILIGGWHSVEEVLDSLLVGTYLDYTESNGNIIVFKKPILIELVGVVVEEETGDPIEGVSVWLQRSEQGTQTDKEGRFRIAAPHDDRVQVSFVGRKSIITRVDNIPNHTDFRVRLVGSVLDVVTVNAGYYQVTNSEQTGSITSITSGELARQPLSNVALAFQGRSPGVLVEQLSGLPGAGYRLSIRGRNSLRDNGNDPLVIFNGVPFPAGSISSPFVGGSILPFASPLAILDPAGIDRMDVLKDADATAIYGSRGANGVILISTRKADEVGLGVNLNVYRGISNVGHTLNLLNGKQWLEMRREAFRNDGVAPNEWNAKDLLKWDTTRSTDWQRKLIGGFSQVTKASMSLHGGENLTKFLFIGGAHRETSVFPGQVDYNRSMGMLNINQKSRNEKLKIDFSAGFAKDDNALPSTDLTELAVRLSPVAPSVRDENGDINWANGTWVNPVAFSRRTYDANASNVHVGIAASYIVSEALTAKINAGYNALERSETKLLPINSYDPSAIALATGTHLASVNAVGTTIAEGQIEYARNVGPGELQVLIGGTLQRTDTEGSTTGGHGYTNDALLEDMGSAATLVSYESKTNEYLYAGTFARANYAWGRRRYLVNITARRDGSSRFSPGDQFGTFGAVGAAWIFTKEEWFDNFPLLSNGKVRASWGSAGSDQIPDYGYMASYRSADYEYRGSALVAARPESPQYSWEKVEKLDLALTFGFLANRIQMDICAYRNRSSRQLLGLSLPVSTGFGTVQYNLPATVENKGIEVTIDVIHANTDRFSWKSAFNLSVPRNKLLRYKNLDRSPDADRYIVGHPLEVRRVLAYEGIDPLSGNFTFSDIDGNGGYEIPEDAYSKDIGVKCYGGFQTTVTAGSFQFYTLFQYVVQDRFNYKYFFPTPGLLSSNQPAEVMDRWQKEGDIAGGHRFTQSPAGNAEYSFGSYFGSQAISDASFLKVKAVSLSYDIRNVMLERLSIKSARLYLQGQNLFTLTRYIGLDPENANPWVLPPLRTVVIGFEITL